MIKPKVMVLFAFLGSACNFCSEIFGKKYEFNPGRAEVLSVFVSAE